MPRQFALAVFATAVIMGVACGTGELPPAPSPTAIAQATVIPTPTAVPLATATVVPSPPSTATVVPSPTTTASPTPVPEPTVAIEVQQYEDYSSMIDSGAVARLDEDAPDFELTLFNGERLQLSQLEGNVVVLNFWASWCPPCRWEMPSFEEMSKEYKDKGVVFLGVAISDYSPDARAFAEVTGVTYPIGLDESGEIARAYRPTSMPTTFFINREGVVSRKLVSIANEAVLRVLLDGQLN